MSAFGKKYEKIICLKKFFDQPADDEFDLDIIWTFRHLHKIIAKITIKKGFTISMGWNLGKKK